MDRKPLTSLRSKAAAKVQMKTEVKTQAEATWIMAASWLDWPDSDWDAFCWDISEKNPLVEVTPNPSFRSGILAGKLPLSQDIPVDPWEEIEWKLYFSEEAQNLPDPNVRRGFLLWCESLDDHGLVQMAVPKIAQDARISLSQAEAALRALQALDPPGIGARSVTEAILLQLRRQNADGPVERAILARPLAEWLREPSWLARVVGFSVSEVQSALARIRRCRPYPLMREKYTKNPLRPRISLWATWDGPEHGWTVTVNDPYEVHCVQMLGGQKDQMARDDKTWEETIHLARALRRRHDVLVAVTRAIVTAQTPYCLGDTSFPRPLSVDTVATATGVHTATVRRVLRERWIAVPRGGVRLRQLVPGISLDRARVQERIRYWVEQGVRSDRLLSEYLQREGLQIARRTVTKWRRELGLVPPRSHQRRSK